MATLISAVVIFLVLVLVHEFGHFITAKLCSVTVHEFAIGMGPVILKKEHKGTLYSLRLIPIGGYCAMEGEDEESDSEGAFGNKKPWQRLLILASGAIMNLLLGLVLMSTIMFSKDANSVYVPVIDTVAESSAEQMAGLKPGDKIVKVNNADIQTYMELNLELSRYREGSIEIEYLRDGERKTTSFVPNKDEEGYCWGITPKVEPLNFGGRLYHTWHYTVVYGKMILVSLFDLVTGKVDFNAISGPVGIVSGIGDAVKMGMQSLISFATLITINLGLFNLLPLPALDGGRMFFVLVEMVIGKKIPADKEGMVHFIGFALLLLLMVFATWNDIVRLIKN